MDVGSPFHSMSTPQCIKRRRTGHLCEGKVDVSSYFFGAAIYRNPACAIEISEYAVKYDVVSL